MSVIVMAQDAVGESRTLKQVMKKLLDNSPIFMEIWDTEGNILDCNEKLLDTLGVSAKDVFTRGFYDYSMPVQPCGKQAAALHDEMLRIAVEYGASRGEWSYKLPGGEPLPTERTWTYIEYPNITGVIVYGIDLRPAKAFFESEAKNRAKRNFLARISHEIRSPLSIILGISEIELRNYAMPPRTKEAFIRIYNASKALLHVVNDILDYSKFESGKMSLLDDEYETEALISDAALLHLTYTENTNITFKLNADPSIPLKLKGDALRLRQIIINLLSNAFKYTEYGTVSLSFSSENVDNGHVLLIVTVEDTGLGMTAAQINESRDEYTRFHENIKPFVSGTGLGLPIVYSLAQMMGAQFDITSEINKGTRVIVRIPQKTAGTEALGQALASKLKSLALEKTTNEEEQTHEPEP